MYMIFNKKPGINLKLMFYVAIVLMLINVTKTKAESSRGFTGKVVEKIGKSRHRIVHSIEVKSSDQSKFHVLPSLRDPIILNRRPGEQILQNKTDVTTTCLRGWKEPDCQTCAQGWTGRNCDTCAQGWKEPDCHTCAQGWKEPDCLTCAQGWKKPDCQECAENFGPPLECTSCETGRTGENCRKCAANFGPPEQCDQCLRGWAGRNCDICATGWTGDNCSTCGPGWIGTECDVCQRFGFSEASGCTECIQNGYWVGEWLTFPMTAHLTFEGAACENVAPGTIVDYNGYNTVVTGGNYDNTTNILRVMDTETQNPTGYVNILTKRISGTIGYNGASFWLNYQRSDNR